ncbi:MAG: dihydrofolate reductase [Lachnospiraceae bacterium]|nr:dihydrofolate reductase [Lachnospiraceae bacterium]
MIGLIVARSKNNVIGKNGKIPWKIKGEQKQFRELTTGNVVVMRRKSYEEIGHPLPNRKNIVVSKSKNFTGENLVTVGSLQEAISISGDENVYIAGGYGLFKEALPLVDTMYITEIDMVIENGDVFFPEFDSNEFDIAIGQTGGEDIKYTRTIYTRRNHFPKRDL